MLFGNDKRVMKATDKYWTYLLILVECEKGRWRVDDHKNFETNTILWGTEEECREEFIRIVDKMELEITK